MAASKQGPPTLQTSPAALHAQRAQRGGMQEELHGEAAVRAAGQVQLLLGGQGNRGKGG